MMTESRGYSLQVVFGGKSSISTFERCGRELTLPCALKFSINNKTFSSNIWLTLSLKVYHKSLKREPVIQAFLINSYCKPLRFWWRYCSGCGSLDSDNSDTLFWMPHNLPFPGVFGRPTSQIARFANDIWVDERALASRELYSLKVDRFCEIEVVFSFLKINYVVACEVTESQRRRRRYKN